MNDPNVTYNAATGRLDFHVSWSPAVELSGYAIRTEWRTISSSGLRGPWREASVMSAWTSDCRYGPGHSYAWVAPAYAYELRWLRQNGHVIDYSTLYGTAKTTAVFDQPPPVPASLRVVDSNVDSLVLAWDDGPGEIAYELERSTDGFQTIDLFRNVAGNATLVTDEGLESARRYSYRIRAVNDAGASAYARLDARTANLYIPDVQGFEDALVQDCARDDLTVSIDLCIRQTMHTHGVYAVTVELCETVNGVPTLSCQRYVLTAPENPPRLPDESDPSVPPPPRYPDGSVWVPPSSPGEPQWQWGSSVDDFPTNRGSWSRACPGGGKEYLHWDSPHPGSPGDHWGYEDCLGRKWDRLFDWVTHGNQWIPYER